MLVHQSVCGVSDRLLALIWLAAQGDPSETIPKLVTDTKAALLVTDYSPLRLGRTWRSQASTRHACTTMPRACLL